MLRFGFSEPVYGAGEIAVLAVLGETVEVATRFDAADASEDLSAGSAVITYACCWGARGVLVWVSRL